MAEARRAKPLRPAQAVHRLRQAGRPVPDEHRVPQGVPGAGRAIRLLRGRWQARLAILGCADTALPGGRAGTHADLLTCTGRHANARGPLNAAHIKKEYACTIDALKGAGILTLLPRSKRSGVVGIDGKEYPVPDLEQVAELFDANRELVRKKTAQGFDRLALTPMAMPLPRLFDLMQGAILKHAAEGNIFQTRRAASEPHIPVRVHKEKQVWVWDTLRQAIETGELVYFPKEYTLEHGGQKKFEVIRDRRICGFAGWSVGLVESSPVMPGQGQGKLAGGRKQLETGFSPNEYRRALQAEEYQGETGLTLEDFMTQFLSRLATTDEVSRDVADGNATWCLAHYLKISYADLVTTGRWIRSVGRVRMDMHRSNNKECTQSFGAVTMVRLGGEAQTG